MSRRKLLEINNLSENDPVKVVMAAMFSNAAAAKGKESTCPGASERSAWLRHCNISLKQAGEVLGNCIREKGQVELDKIVPLSARKDEYEDDSDEDDSH